MSPRAFRRLMFVLSAALAAVVIVLVVVDTDGEPGSLPVPLRSVSPPPGDVVVRQTGITVELPVGYELALTVDGVRIPPDEIDAVGAIGTFRWQPGPGRIIEQWAPGDHTIEIEWDRVAGGRPDPGEFSWTFRVV